MKQHTAEEVGISSLRLARIDDTMTKAVAGGRLPGIMTLLQRRGKVVHLGRYGWEDIAAQRPMREEALFRIYSMTKPIVSVALMMLLEEGRLRLQDPVAKYIPAFAKTRVYAGSGKLGLTLVDQNPPLTVHHLLTHTAGLSYGWFFDHPVDALYRDVLPSLFNREQPLAEVVDALAALPLLFQPGTQWRYSHATDVVGHLVAVIAGMPLDVFLSERIFAPLGMVDTAFTVPPEKLGRLAPIYTSPALYGPLASVAADVRLIGDVTQPTSCPSAGAGLVSTLADYLAFANCLLNGGRYDGGRLLSRKTLALMTADHIPAALKPLSIGPDPVDYGFGLGFRVATSLGEARTVTSVGEFGWAGAANTYFWVDPAEEFIGLMLTQHLPTAVYPYRELFKNLAYQAIDD